MTKNEIQSLITEKIKTNGEGEITAEVLADVLSKMTACDNTVVIPISETASFTISEDGIIDSDEAEKKRILKAIFGVETPSSWLQAISSLDKDYILAPLEASNENLDSVTYYGLRLYAMVDIANETYSILFTNNDVTFPVLEI